MYDNAIRNAEGLIAVEHWKFCRVCETTKPISLFYKHKGHSDGYSSNCKECADKTNKKYAKENPDKIKKCYTNWRKENPEKSRKISERNNHSLVHREWEISVREHTNERKLNWRKENPDKVKQYSDKHYQKYKDEIKISSKKYKYARRGAVGCDLTLDEFTELLHSYNNKCCYCGIDVKNKPTIDHIVPISKGGTNLLDNMTVACVSCNSKKQNKSLLQFMYWRLSHV